MALENTRVLWASQIPPPTKGNFLHSGWEDKLALAYRSFIDTNKRKLAATDHELFQACRWLIEALYQSVCSLPPVPLAIPKSPNAYSLGKDFAPPFGYRITIDLIHAAIKAGYVTEDLGQWNPNGIGSVSRYTPIERLKKHFDELGNCWQEVPPLSPDKSIVISTSPKGKNRRLALDGDHQDIKVMRSRLKRINQFLSRNCIWIDLPDQILLKGSKALQSKLEEAVAMEAPELSSVAINFQHVHLRRIFAMAFDQGGRFYGGWWQQINSDYRSRILINDHKTTECDFSALAVRMLYAIEGITPPMGDLYDLGFSYHNDPVESRRKVKKFVTAILNDKEKSFRLSNSDLDFIGVSHSRLLAALNQKHAAISHHFYSGIGLKLQFIDSKIAEDVMIHFLNKSEVCLPVHDSFIVRQGLELELEKVMHQSFKKHLNGIAKVDKESGYNKYTLAEIKELPHTYDPLCMVSQHLEDFSIALSFFSTWEQSTFSKKELLAREQQRLSSVSM